MLVTKITNHVEAALKRLLYQYQGLPNMTALITALIIQVQKFEDAAYAIDAARQLYDGTSYIATGAQLDGIGKLVNQPRNGLTDPQYLILILGTIAENFSDGSLETMRAIVKTLTGATVLGIFEKYPAGYAVAMTGQTIDVTLWALVGEIIQASLGGGIQLCYMVTYDPDNVFTFEGGKDDGQGFPPWSTDPQTSGGAWPNQVYGFVPQEVGYITDELDERLTDEDGNPLITG